MELSLRAERADERSNLDGAITFLDCRVVGGSGGALFTDTFDLTAIALLLLPYLARCPYL